METRKKRNLQLMKKATSIKDLINRSDSNRAYAKNDFNLWVNNLLDEMSFSSALDVCCGNGNQLVLYVTKPEVTRIVGVDVSEQALEAARKRFKSMGLSTDIVLKATKMEDMFHESELAKSQFDLISCCYGLYYSEDAGRTLQEMIEHLSKKGILLVVGPYGANNKALFSLLEHHFKLPELVIRSSMTFMENEVFPILAKHLYVKKESFINQICYPNVKALVDYWKSSTFYFKGYEDAVVNDIKKHFARNREFIVEKHVLAYIARKTV